MAKLRSAISRNSWGWSCLATLALTVSPTQAEARDDPRLRVDIESTSLPEAIAELAREANLSIGTEGSLPHVRTREIHAKLSIEAALRRLLRGTGYVARQAGPTAWRIDRVRAPSTPAPAPSPADLPPVAVTLPEQEIVVTATKRDLKLEDIPLAADVIVPDPAHRLDPASGTAHVAGQVEGLSLTGQGAGRNRIFLRGVADSPFGGKNQATVAVLLDDARLTYVAPDPDIRLVDVYRVELLKGPQGSLYGSGALGGIYRIVTNRADPSGFAIGGAVSGQSVTEGELGGSASLVVNLPLVADVAALRVVGYGEKSPGWLDTGERKDSNGGSVLGLRVGLGIEAGGGWRADLTGFGQWLNARDSNYTYQPEANQRPAQLAEPHDNDLLHGSVRLVRDGAVRIVLSTGITHHEVRDTYDATQGADGFGLADPQTLHDRARYRLWDSEARLTGSLGRLGWLGGIAHVEARQNSSRVLNGLNGDTLTLETVARREDETALFGEATLPLSDTLDATLGGRLFSSTSYEDRATTVEEGTKERARTSLTLSAALAWHPRAGRLLYLRYGSASRQGGTTAAANGQVTALEGDELTTLEAGWREEAGPWSLDLSLYRSWWENIQSDVLLANGMIETANVGQGSIVGAEMTGKARLGGRWRLEAGGMVQSAQLVRDQSGLKLEDRRLPVVPAWTLRGSLAHDIPLGDWLATVTAGARFVGPARLSFDPALDRPMGNYLQTDFGVAATRGRLTVELAATNLFNGRGDSFAYGNPLRILTTRQYIRQEPFGVRLSLSVTP